MAFPTVSPSSFSNLHHHTGRYSELGSSLTGLLKECLMYAECNTPVMNRFAVCEVFDEFHYFLIRC